MPTRLQPILNVRNLEVETQFYVRLGFRVTHQENGFVGLSWGEELLFGLKESRSSDPNAFEEQMYWQFGVDSVGEVARHCEREGIPIQSPMALQSWGEWLLVLRSPGGYRVAIEGPK